MRARSFILYIFIASVALAFGAESARPKIDLSLQSLRARLTQHVSQEKFRSAQWGIKIASVSSGKTVFELDPQKLLKPASTAKLFTGALALDVLGADYKIKTSLYAKSPPQNGAVNGDLLVYGRGDPTFSSTFEGSPRNNVLARIVQAIRSAGIKRIDGDLIGDATFFAGPPYGSGWTWDDLQYEYGAEVSALSIEDNITTVTVRPGEVIGEPCNMREHPLAQLAKLEWINRSKTVAPKTATSLTLERAIGQNRVFIRGSLAKGALPWTETVSIANPTLWFVTILKEELSRVGIEVKGAVRALIPPNDLATDLPNWTEIASVTSVPLEDVVEKMMKLSQNLYAQLLLLQVGAISGGPKRQDVSTEELGLKRLEEFVARAGIKTGMVRLDDGAGLSRSGLVSPEAVVQLLRFMTKQTYADSFRSGLPEPGGEGTLRSRLKELEGRLQAKTGTLRYVNTLAGYLTTNAGEELAFAVMLNAYAGSSNGRDEIDTIPRLVAQLNERTAQ